MKFGVTNVYITELQKKNVMSFSGIHSKNEQIVISL